MERLDPKSVTQLSDRKLASVVDEATSSLEEETAVHDVFTSASLDDFDREAESYYKKSVVRDFLKEIESARKRYYDDLAKKLETARALVRGTREPTKEERDNPPPTEVELRAERLKKELRWRTDEEGFNIIRPDKNVEWDERFRNVLRVYTAPSPEQIKSDDIPVAPS